MNLKQQIRSLRDTAFQLSLAGSNVWHAGSGVRGQTITTEPVPGQPGERADFRRPLLERAYRKFMRKFLCTGDPVPYVAEAPWRTLGFSFAAAGSGCSRPTVQQEGHLEGVGHSFVYGDQESLERLGRLVAMPAVRYLSSISTHGWVREDSWGSPETALGDWVYIIYEIGLKASDPNLRRFYRFITPFAGTALGTGDDVLFGFDGHGIHRGDVRQQRVWQLLWRSAGKKEVAFARLGTELTLASRIALDYLLGMEMSEVGDAFYGKWQAESRFDRAQQAQLVRATNHVLGQATLNKGSLSAAIRDGHIKYNGRSGRACRVEVRSFLAWIERKENLPREEVVQVRIAIMAEINEAIEGRN
ncbi:MAG: hypothetical protein JXL80_09120 [Planctomycetes bacterium]|nr:hypothetical protein [Planctomycetota bacterium]